MKKGAQHSADTGEHCYKHIMKFCDVRKFRSKESSRTLFLEWGRFRGATNTEDTSCTTRHLLQ